MDNAFVDGMIELKTMFATMVENMKQAFCLLVELKSQVQDLGDEQEEIHRSLVPLLLLGDEECSEAGFKLPSSRKEERKH